MTVSIYCFALFCDCIVVSSQEVQLSCGSSSCINVNVTCKCNVTNVGLRWIIRDNNMVESQSYNPGDPDVGPDSISVGAGSFTTLLTSPNTNPIESTLSFTVKTDFDGLIVQCEEAVLTPANTLSSTIDILGKLVDTKHTENNQFCWSYILIII